MFFFEDTLPTSMDFVERLGTESPFLFYLALRHHLKRECLEPLAYGLKAGCTLFSEYFLKFIKDT